MPPDLPSKTSKEIHVEMHPVPGERPSKSSRRGNDKDGKKVVIDSRQHGKRSDQCFARIYGTRPFPDGRLVDDGPNTNP